MVVITRWKARPWWGKSSGSVGAYTSFRGALAGGKGLMLMVTLTTLWPSISAGLARTSSDDVDPDRGRFLQPEPTV